MIRSEPGRTERAQATFDGDGQLAALVLTASNDRDDEEHTTTVRYLWGSVGQIPQILAQRADTESHDSGQFSAEFSYGYGRAFASGEHGAATFHHDAFGSALRTQDTSPWVQANQYDAFGLPRNADFSADDREHRRAPELPKFGYRGEQALGSVINLRARAYDTRLGRFTTRDPIITPMTAGPAANPYTYAANDPLNAIDPLGTVLVAPLGGGNLQSPAPERHDAVHHATAALHASTRMVPNPPGTGRTGTCTLYTAPFGLGHEGFIVPFGLEHETYLSESDTQKLIHDLELITQWPISEYILWPSGVLAVLAVAVGETVGTAVGFALVGLGLLLGEWEAVGHLLSLIDERGGHRGITFTWLANPLGLPPVPGLPSAFPATFNSSGAILGGTPIPYVWYQPASLPANLCAPPMLRPTPEPGPPPPGFQQPQSPASQPGPQPMPRPSPEPAPATAFGA